MNNFGLKISSKGSEVTEAGLKELILESTYPLWKCDIRANPRHYGLVRGLVNIGAGTSKTIFTVSHGYAYLPTFLVAWAYPNGTSPALPNDNQTYGVGDVEAITSGGILTFKTTVDGKELKIVADNTASSSNETGIPIDLRFYIFAEDLPVYTYSPITMNPVAT